ERAGGGLRGHAGGLTRRVEPGGDGIRLAVRHAAAAGATACGDLEGGLAVLVLYDLPEIGVAHGCALTRHSRRCSWPTGAPALPWRRRPRPRDGSLGGRSPP